MYIFNTSQAQSDQSSREAYLATSTFKGANLSTCTCSQIKVLASTQGLSLLGRVTYRQSRTTGRWWWAPIWDRREDFFSFFKVGFRYGYWLSLYSYMYVCLPVLGGLTSWDTGENASPGKWWQTLIGVAERKLCLCLQAYHFLIGSHSINKGAYRSSCSGNLAI